ncbi:MAG: PilZ domain-containing protein [Myxococcaceae bacterium]|nr:PilZ domain-containing protein [Myxococcaceae bacterium]
MLQSRSVRTSRHLPLLLGNRLPVRTADVSTGGFSLEAPFVFMPGSLLHGTLEVAGRELPFRGEVVWARPAGQPEAPSRMGVRFTEVAPEARCLLEE